MGRMYAVKAVAERWNTTVPQVLALIHNNELKAINIARSPNSRKARWRISEEALAAFEATRANSKPMPRASRKRRPADVVKFY